MAGGLQKQGGKVGSNTERAGGQAGGKRRQRGRGVKPAATAGETGGKPTDNETARKRRRKHDREQIVDTATGQTTKGDRERNARQGGKVGSNTERAGGQAGGKRRQR